MKLSDGAVELPPRHLSARVPWHDTDWTGRVCAQPHANHACAVLKNVKQSKDADRELANRGVAWTDLPQSDLPPCVVERAGFMRSAPFTHSRQHAYARPDSESHAHFAPTEHWMPAYSLEATPFRWTLRDNVSEHSRRWGISYDQDLEDEADRLIGFGHPTNWVQDHRNQLALLDSFFSALRPGSSLVFVYAKDVPLLEERDPGARVLVGVGRVTGLDPVVEWEYSGEGPIRSVLWERAVHHSIRPAGLDGFLLPYQQLVADPALAGEDMGPLVALAPRDHFDEFSYVSELVSDDAAIAALMELARVVDLLPGVADGPWETVSKWIADSLAAVWSDRGPYPGLGAALVALGLDRGPIIAHRLQEQKHDGDDPWKAVEAAMAQAADGAGAAAGLVGRTGRKVWERLLLDPERYRLLRLISRFGLTSAQARRLFDREERAESGIRVADGEILDNPYLLHELTEADPDPVAFEWIDRGLFPQAAAARRALKADPLPEPVEEASDDRRVRAASAHVLGRAAEQGHTVLDESGLRRAVAALPIDPVCDPTSDLFELAASEFAPVLVERPLARDGRAWQLARLARATTLIATEVNRRIAAGSLDVGWPWRDLIDVAIGDSRATEDETEESARVEKAAALRVLARARVGILVGKAGTGKTTLLRALCSQPEIEAGGVLLLAPTGKARVQLGDKAGLRAQTLAQFLAPARWSFDRGYFLDADAPVVRGFRTVVVDEASMLTEEMLAALIEAVGDVDRLVLCGDHRQLPPIGAGRPFADLVRRLTSGAADGDGSSGGGLAELRVGRRQDSDAVAGRRDDMSVADWFSGDAPASGADAALARVLAGQGDGTVEIVSWDDEEDLHRLLVERLCESDELGLGERTADALKRSLGADGDYNGRPSFNFGKAGEGAERWQLLSPVRSRVGGVAGLNALIRATWRPGDAAMARRSWKLPSPAGADEVLFHDKVIAVHNHRRTAWMVEERKERSGEVANGEIGMVSWWAKRKGLKVEFSSQPGAQFTFWTGELNADREQAVELLELAYAITIHKAQGSQFMTTLVVVPNPCPLLSTELLYTALTRHRGRTVVLVQGDPAGLRELADPARSETGRRLTCLFDAPDPFRVADGPVLDGSHLNRSANGEPMRSKSEVIVANAFRALDVEYSYEELLTMPDGSWRRPDFTIRLAGRPPIYWEHLGMLDLHGYRADWMAKRSWYAEHGILPWEAGGGPSGTLVWSTENEGGRGIDAAAIEQLARDVLA